MADRDIVFPPRDLGGRAQEWGRTLESVYRDVALDTETLKQSLQGLNRSTASSLQSISDQLQAISDQNLRLEDASKAYYADSGSTTWTLNSGAWASSPPSVVASSLSGRFLVTVGAGANNGDGAVTFATTGYARARIAGNSGAAVSQRAGVSGGASFTPSVSRTWAIALDPGVNYTFSCEFLSFFTGTVALGLSILVQPLL